MLFDERYRGLRGGWSGHGDGRAKPEGSCEQADDRGADNKFEAHGVTPLVQRSVGNKDALREDCDATLPHSGEDRAGDRRRFALMDEVDLFDIEAGKDNCESNGDGRQQKN